MSEVCQCKGEDHTVAICIGEYRRCKAEADKWFNMLKKHCGKHKNGNCILSAGMVQGCYAEQCPMIEQ